MKNNRILAVIIFFTLASSKSWAFPFFSKEPKSQEQENTQIPDNSNEKLTLDKIDQSNFAGIAVLQCLNKITAKTSEINVKVGSEFVFDKLTIKVDKCWKSPAYQRPENKILLEVFETLTDGTKKLIFYGWMFSSSPSISGLEHPVYDITAIACKK